MGSGFYFFRRFLQRPKQISSLIPTSKVTLEHIAARVTKTGRLVIVELGPGTGGLTELLLSSGTLSGDSRLILIEIDEEFARRLTETIRDPRVRVFHRSAEDVREILRECGEEKADYIFSSIPLSMMPIPIVSRMLMRIQEVLADDGNFILFVVRDMKDVLLKFFPFVTMRVELLNIPPLLVHEARKTEHAK